MPKNIIFVSQPGIMKQAAFLVLVALLLSPSLSLGQFRKIYIDSDSNTYVTGIHFLSAKEGYVGFNKWIGYTQDSGHTFTKKYITSGNVDFNGNYVNLTFGFRTSGVYAFSKDSLLVYGDYGFVPAILFSSDQGNSFKLIYHSTLELNIKNEGIKSIQFPENSNIGYAVEKNRVLKTTDRGKSWNVIYNDLNSSLYDISFLNTSVGYVADNNKLLKTENGGADWRILNMPAGVINAISFISVSKGWVNIDNKAYYTWNGGNSWESLSNEFEFINRPIKFITDSIGFFAGGAYVYKTSDGGRVWEPLSRDNDFRYYSYAGDKLFILNQSIWRGSGHGLLELSTNGGGITMPVARFTADLSQLNSLNKVILNNYSKKGNQYQWFRNSNLIGTTFNASYISDRLSIDTIMLVVKKGAFTDTSDIITIDTRANTQQCYAAFTISSDTGTVKINAGYHAAGVKHYWDFGDGYIDSLSINPIHSYKSVGTYTIKHSVYNTIDKCTNSATNQVVIYRTKNCLSLDFSYVADTFYTNNLTFKFSYDETTEHERVPNAIAFETLGCNWGDGSTTVSFSHEYATAGFYNACFQLKNKFTGCISQICKPVEVKMPAGCDASFLLNDWTEGNVEVIAKPHANDADKRHTWIFNDKDTISTGTGKYLQKLFFKWDYSLRSLYYECSNGSYRINLDSTHNTIKHIVYDIKTKCTDTVEKDFILRLSGGRNLAIVGIPNKDFLWKYNFFLFDIKNNDSTLIYAKTWKVDSCGINYQTANPSGWSSLGITFKGPGRYQVGTFADGCGGSDIGQFYYIYVDVPAMDCPVYPPGFTSSVVNIATPNKIYFYNPDFYTQQDLGNSPQWVFGDGDSAITFNPTHEYKKPGVYTVTLRYTNPNGCFKEISKEITITPPCTLKTLFSFARNEIIPAKIAFNDATTGSNGSITYKWFFGTGDSSSERNPVYMYETPGAYKITLQTKDQQLCQSSYDTTTVITPEDICNVKAGFEYVSQNDEVQFSNLSAPDNSLYSYLWDFGDDTNDNHQNPKHIYQSTGQYNVCLKTYRDPLCSAEVCDTLIINIVRRVDAGVYPNPADAKIVAEFESEVAAEITISIFNNNGIEIYNKRKNCMAGLNKEQIDIISLPKGSYVLKITGLNKSITKRFIKQ